MANYNMNAKDLFNAHFSSKTVKDYLGVVLKASGCATEDEVNSKTGELIEVGYIATDVGVIGFTSKTLISSLDGLMDFMAEFKDPVEIQFNSSISNGGKEFYTLEIK